VQWKVAIYTNFPLFTLVLLSGVRMCRTDPSDQASGRLLETSLYRMPISLLLGRLDIVGRDFISRG
jgi:hypothetical protein